MKASVDAISFTLDIRVHLAPLREVFDEFQRKVSELSPQSQQRTRYESYFSE